MALGFEIHLVRNPWPDTVPALGDILQQAASERARSIESRIQSGEYRREAMALVVLDPTAPMTRASEEAVLAIICIGDEGPRFAPNAMAKAVEHRDHGVECGALALSQKHRLADGDFRSGFSAEVSGTIVGGSGQNSLQDQFEATMLAAELNYEVGRARQNWEENQGRGGWFQANGTPGERYVATWEQPVDSVLRG